MGKKSGRTSTEWLIDAVEMVERETCESPSFPPLFVMGLRAALDSGLSCEQITAFLVLFTGVYETAERMSGEEIVNRATYLGRIIREDIDEQTELKRIRRKRKREREQKKRERARWRG